MEPKHRFLGGALLTLVVMGVSAFSAAQLPRTPPARVDPNALHVFHTRKGTVVINGLGKPAFENRYYHFGPYSEGLIAFSQPPPGRDPISVGPWGYLDSAGKVVIPAQFSAADPFREGLASIEAKSGVAGSVAFIDRTGAVVVPPRYMHAAEFSEGLALVFGRAERGGYIDKMGKTVIPHRFAAGRAENFSEGLAAAGEAGDAPMGYLKKDGAWAIQPQFPMALSFHEGLALVADEAGDRYIDKSGKPVFAVPPGLRGRSFSSGLAMVHDRFKFGFIDKAGKMVVRVTYAAARDFDHGLAAVKVGSKWGFIDPTGKLVLEARYEPSQSARQSAAITERFDHLLLDKPFEWVGGLCAVRIGDAEALIDQTGKVVWSESQ